MVQEKKMLETKKDNIGEKENSKSKAQYKEESGKSAAKGSNNSTLQKNDTEKNSILFYILTIVTALLVVLLIIGGSFFIAIKKDVNGIAESMRDSIDGIPILRLALPEQPDPEDEKNMTEEQVRSKYTEIKNRKDELEKQVTELTSQVEQLNKQLSAKDTNSTLLQQQKDALEKEKDTLTKEKETLKKQFDSVSAAIANGDTAEFKNYYEQINPDKAAELYAQIIKDKKMSDDVKKYCSIYEAMDASAVASIMEQMGTGKMTLIVEIVKNLNKDTSANILAEMTPAFAAKVSEQLAKEYSVGTAKKATN
jgi:flagellar motility protein MotE (MotC chaperone)